MKGRDLTKKAKKPHDLPKYMKRDFINNVISTMPPSQDRTLVTFLWMTGVRITEALSLQKKDIDFVNRMMTIKWLKSRKYLFRNVPIHAQLMPLLIGHSQFFKAEQRIFPISRQRAFQVTKKWFDCSPHQFRHSFAVNWLQNKGDILMLSRILGHTKIYMTMEYLKIVPVDQAVELEKITFW